jgi:hypothetical protein
MLKTQPALFQRNKTTPADHQVVQHRDIQQLPGLDQRPGDGHIVIIYMENLFDTLYLSR